MDITEIRASYDVDRLLVLSGAATSRERWEGIRASDPDAARIADGALDEEILPGVRLRDVTPLQSLAAATTLADLLTGWRWIDMRAAREQGATWQEIGDAAGMTRQSAHELYRRKITAQEQHVGDLHDTDRSRAALGDVDRDDRIRHDDKVPSHQDS